MTTVVFNGVEYEVTEWVTDGTPPAIPGVYNISCRKNRQSGEWYAYFDGKRWTIAYRTIEKWESRSEIAAMGKDDNWHIYGSWRGIALG